MERHVRAAEAHAHAGLCGRSKLDGARADEPIDRLEPREVKDGPATGDDEDREDEDGFGEVLSNDDRAYSCGASDAVLDFDDHHGAVRVPDDGLRRVSEEDAAQAGPATAGHDDKVGL